MWIVLDGPVDAIWIENLNTVRLRGGRSEGRVARLPALAPTWPTASSPRGPRAHPFPAPPPHHQVLDDNKVLTLANGDRILMTPQMKARGVGRSGGRGRRGLDTRRAVRIKTRVCRSLPRP